MIRISFHRHAQTEDNVAGVASGHRDAQLTSVGRARASTEWHERFANESFDVIFTSDTQRAHETASLIFAGRGIPIIQDARLRECNYGDLEGHPQSEIAAVRGRGPNESFPNGESYVEVASRMAEFLGQLGKEWDGRRVMIVGHRATSWTLKHFAEGVPLGDALESPLTMSANFEYDPG